MYEWQAMVNNSCAAFEKLFAFEIETLRSRLYLVKLGKLAVTGLKTLS